MESKTSNYYDISDEQLVFMINENNEDAKDELYKKYSPLIHKELNAVKRSAYALGIEWQDLMQEAMLGFSNAISTYDDTNNTKFITFATMCIRRKLINYINKNSTNKSFTLKSAFSLETEVDEKGTELIMYLKDLDGKEPLNKLMIDEELEEVDTLVKNNLNEEEQQILELSIDGKSPNEIAEIIGKPTKTVYNILYRIRKKIKI